MVVDAAYIQYVWLRLRQKYVSLGTIDAAFNALGNLFSLATLELIKCMHIAVVIVLIFWSVIEREIR